MTPLPGATAGQPAQPARRPDAPWPAGPGRPAIVTHYAAYLRAKSKLTPDVTVHGNRATLAIGRPGAALTLTFARRKQAWRLQRLHVRRSEATASFTTGQLDQAITALLIHQPPTPAPPATSGPSRQPTCIALHRRRASVIRE